MKLKPSVDHASPTEDVLVAFWARYSRKMVSLSTIAVGLYVKADSKLLLALGLIIGLWAYF